MSKCIVYCLYEVGKRDVIRYVGQTKLKPAKRLKWHIKASKGATLTRVQAWISSVARLGGAVAIKVLDANATWDVTEVQIIDRLRAEGQPLMNVLDGGKDSLKDLRRRSKKKLRAKVRKIKRAAGWRWGSLQKQVQP